MVPTTIAEMPEKGENLNFRFASDLENKFSPFAQKWSLLQKVTKENKLAGIFVDLGIYGWSPLSTWAGKDPTLRMFEKFTLKHGGYQVFQSFQIPQLSNLTRLCKKKHIVIYS